MGDAHIQFEASLFGAATVAVVPPGERLMDACDAVDAPVPFSCRDASCGTCLVEVTQGAALLDAPAAEERVVLAALGRWPRGGGVATEAGAARHRLACQAVVVAAGAVTVRLARPAPDD